MDPSLYFAKLSGLFLPIEDFDTPLMEAIAAIGGL
jgi:hypothetical protein